MSKCNEDERTNNGVFPVLYIGAIQFKVLTTMPTLSSKTKIENLR